MTEQERTQAKIDRLRFLQEQYRFMQMDATKEEKVALTFASAVMQKRFEVASRKPVGRACPVNGR